MSKQEIDNLLNVLPTTGSGDYEIHHNNLVILNAMTETDSVIESAKEELVQRLLELKDRS